MNLDPHTIKMQLKKLYTLAPIIPIQSQVVTFGPPMDPMPTFKASQEL